MADVPCSCGGFLRACKFSGDYDVSTELGLPAVVRGAMGLKCTRCGGSSLAGSVLEALSDDAVLLLLKLDRRLSGAEARFLRKAALGLGQADLAKSLGLTRVTVARWEGDDSLSAQHDFLLRALTLARLSRKALRPGRWKSRRCELTSLVITALDAARTTAAPQRRPPLRLQG